MPIPAGLQAIIDRLASFYNGNAYNPTSNPGGFARGGNQQGVFIAAMRDVAGFGQGIVTIADGVEAARAEVAQNAAAADGSADAAFQSEQNAADSAAASAVQAARLQGTSTTSQTPATGSKTFATQTGKAFDVGNDVRVQSRSDINRWMTGRVSAYASGSVTVLVDAIGSVVTAAADWDIRVAGARGAQGIQGIPGIPTMGYSARTANAQIVAADAAKLIDITAGTFTQTFAAAATLGAGFYIVLRNAGTGDITLDPNGSETIDGLASFISYPGEVRLVQCDGTALRSVVVQGFTKSFIASDNFIKPPGYRYFNGMIWSGGAAGRNSTAAQVLGGGGGGSFPFTLDAAKLASSTPVVIGAGGQGTTVKDTVPAAGGDSSFGPIKVKGAVNQIGGSVIALLSNGESQRTSQNDPFSYVSNNVPSIYGGASTSIDTTIGGTIYGGGSGGSNQSGTNYPVGPTLLGGAGGAASNGGIAGDGAAPGGGGGACYGSSGGRSGSGARGQLDLWGAV